jgi:phosphoribosylanthranilate isomerase
MGRVARAPRIKLCGITRLEDARKAVEAGAWAIGMILWPGSARACDPVDAARIAAVVRRRIELAGVFVNQPLDEVEHLATTIPLSMVQLHGEEGPAYCAEVARRTGAKVIKAARVRSGEDVQALGAFPNVDYHLLDTFHDGLRGGTGEAFDWTLVGRRPSTKVPLILSGGLTAANVGAAIAAAHPFAVDVASGVESAPGIKDHALIDAFATAVRAVEHDGPSPLGGSTSPHLSGRARSAPAGGWGG